jgi:hypothetical protein
MIPTLPVFPLFAYFINKIGDGRLDEHDVVIAIKINEVKPWYYLDGRLQHIVLRMPFNNVNDHVPIRSNLVRRLPMIITDIENRITL